MNRYGKIILINLVFILCPDLSAQSNKVIPDIPLFTTSGDTVLLDQLTGKKPVLFYFWATWCKVCAKDMSKVFNLEKDVDGAVKFIGVAWKDTPQEVDNFLKKRDLMITTVIDRHGALFDKLQVKYTPTIIIVNDQREILFQGYGSKRKLRRILNKISKN